MGAVDVRPAPPGFGDEPGARGGRTHAVHGQRGYAEARHAKRPLDGVEEGPLHHPCLVTDVGVFLLIAPELDEYVAAPIELLPYLPR